MLALWSVLGHSREALNVVSFPHEVENDQTEGEEEGHGAWCLEDCVRTRETRQQPGWTLVLLHHGLWINFQ